MTALNRLDHIAILVSDTDKALEVFHHRLALPIVFTEILQDQGVRLTHLDLGGGAQLQLVQPLRDDIPLAKFLAERGEGLHHIAFYVDDLRKTLDALASQGIGCQDILPRSAPGGKKAVFLNRGDTYGVLVELTGHLR